MDLTDNSWCDDGLDCPWLLLMMGDDDLGRWVFGEEDGVTGSRLVYNIATE